MSSFCFCPVGQCVWWWGGHGWGVWSFVLFILRLLSLCPLSSVLFFWGGVVGGQVLGPNQVSWSDAKKMFIAKLSCSLVMCEHFVWTLFTVTTIQACVCVEGCVCGVITPAPPQRGEGVVWHHISSLVLRWSLGQVATLRTFGPSDPLVPVSPLTDSAWIFSPAQLHSSQTDVTCFHCVEIPSSQCPGMKLWLTLCLLSMLMWGQGVCFYMWGS